MRRGKVLVAFDGKYFFDGMDWIISHYGNECWAISKLRTFLESLALLGCVYACVLTEWCNFYWPTYRERDVESNRANIALNVISYKLFDCQTIFIITRNNIFEQPMTRRNEVVFNIHIRYTQKCLNAFAQGGVWQFWYFETLQPEMNRITISVPSIIE